MWAQYLCVSFGSDIPSSFESQAQFMNIDAKETFAAESIAHDHLPKDGAGQGILNAANENAFPVRVPVEQAAQPIQQATSMFGGVSQDAIIQMQQQQQQQTMATAADSAPATAVAVASTSTPASTEPLKDLESASPTKSQPVRKISRFLVSPAILTVTNEKSAQNICIEDPIKSPAINPTLAQSAPNFIPSMANTPLDPQNDPQKQVSLRR